MKNIGVFGGSFDPVHIGHLHIARDAAACGKLDELLFMPSNIQPFKQDSKVAPAEDRLVMLRESMSFMQNTPQACRFDVTDVEISSGGVSYTAISLSKLRKEYGTGYKFWFILGADMFQSIEKWYLHEEILSEYGLIVMIRHGTGEDEIEANAEVCSEKYGTEYILCKNNLYDFSSSRIRENVRNGRSIEAMVAPMVEKYIIEKGLYQ